MNKKEGQSILLKYCDDEIAKSGWWIFNKKKLYLEFSRIHQTWERSVNMRLPELMSFSSCEINKDGIDVGSAMYQWNNISAVAIKRELINIDNDSYGYLEDLVFCTKEGFVIERRLGDTSRYYDQLGHLIEMYRENFQKNENTTNA